MPYLPPSPVSFPASGQIGIAFNAHDKISSQPFSETKMSSPEFICHFVRYCKPMSIEDNTIIMDQRPMLKTAFRKTPSSVSQLYSQYIAPNIPLSRI